MEIIFVGAANPEAGRMIRAVKAVQPDFRVRGFLDNDPKKKGKMFVGFPVLGGFEILEQFKAQDVRFVNLITGNMKTRYEVSRTIAQRGFKFTNFIHPSTDTSEIEMGTGNYIQEAVILQAEVRIGNNSSVSALAHVAHEVTIGHSVFVAHQVSISGIVTIGDGTFVGTNATILPRITVGKWATIGAGAVVLSDVPDGATVVSNPGRVIKISTPPYPTGDPFAGFPQ